MDLEGGYGVFARQVAETVKHAAQTGIVGFNFALRPMAGPTAPSARAIFRPLVALTRPSHASWPPALKRSPISRYTANAALMAQAHLKGSSLMPTLALA